MAIYDRLTLHDDVLVIGANNQILRTLREDKYPVGHYVITKKRTRFELEDAHVFYYTQVSDVVITYSKSKA